MPKKLYGTPVEDERNDIIKQLQPPAVTPNPLGGALADARQPEQVRPATPLIDYSKVPDLNKIATANNQAITNANNGPSVAGQNGRPDTGSLNTQGPAMSREAANDSYANFEDFFNKNTGYAAKYRSQVRNHLGDPSAIENTLPGSVARTGTTENGNFGATQAAGFGGIPPPQTPNQTPAASTPEPAKPDSGNPFTSGGGQNSFTQRSPNPPAQTGPAGASGGKGTNQGPGGTQLSQIKQAVEDPPTTPKATTPSTPLTDIQKTADAGNPFTRAGGTQWNAPAPNAAPAPDPQRDALLQELSNLPTGRTAAEDAEVRRLSHAEDDVASLGLDGGQDLLSELNNQPVDPMDAAFMNVAGGRDNLDKYKKTFEGATGRAEKALSDKYGAVQKRRDEITQELANRKNAADTAPRPSTSTPAQGSDIPEYQGSSTDPGQLADFLFPEATSDIHKGEMGSHALAMNASPIDQIAMGIGEAGNDVDLPTQMVSGAFIGGIAQDSWHRGNILAGLQRVTGWGGGASAKFITALKRNPAMLKEFMTFKNPGYVAYRIREWFKANGIKPPAHVDRPENSTDLAQGGVHSAPNANGKSDASDTEIELTLSMGKPYTDQRTGRTFKSLDEYRAWKRTGR